MKWEIWSICYNKTMKKILLILFTILLLYLSIDQACGCACMARWWGFKSYFTGNSYPSLDPDDYYPSADSTVSDSEETDNDSQNGLTPPDKFPKVCFCSCHYVVRIPIELLVLYIAYLVYYIKTKNKV